MAIETNTIGFAYINDMEERGREGERWLTSRSAVIAPLVLITDQMGYAASKESMN
jgi:hypothetical protein